MRKKLVVAMMSMVLATGSILPAYANILTDEVIEINKEIQEEVKENDNEEEIIKEEETEVTEEKIEEGNKKEEVIQEPEKEVEEKIDEEVNDEIEIRSMSNYSLTALDQDIIDNPSKYFKTWGSKITGFKMNAFTIDKIKDIKTLTIPSKIGSKEIDTISEVSFWVSDGNEDNIINAKVIIPDSITKIENFAFYENQIEELEMGNNVQSIGEYAFFKNRISELEINNALSTIGTAAFYENQIKNLKLNDKLKIIGNNAFDKNLLINLKLNNGLEIIGNNAFNTEYSSDAKIKGELIIPDSVTDIGTMAFRNQGIDKLILNNKVKDILEETFVSNNLVEIEIPDSVEYIRQSAFHNNKLRKVTLGPNLKKVEGSSFWKNQLSDIDLSKFNGDIEMGAMNGQIFPYLNNFKVNENLDFQDKNLLFWSKYQKIFFSKDSLGKNMGSENMFGPLLELKYLELGNGIDKNFKDLGISEMPIKRVVYYNPLISLAQDDLVGDIEVVGFKQDHIDGIRSFTSNNLSVKDNKTEVSHNDNIVNLNYEYIVNEEKRDDEEVENLRLVDRPIDLDIIIEKISGTKLENINLIVGGIEVQGIILEDAGDKYICSLPKDIYLGEDNKIEIKADLVVDTTKDFENNEIKISPKVLATSEDGNTKEDIIGNEVTIKIDKSENPVNPPVDPEKPSKPSKPNRPNKDKNKEEKNENKKEESKNIEEKFNISDHFEYLNGYEDDTVKPEKSITREESTAVIYRILNPEYRNSIKENTSSFNDIKANRWSSKHIGTLEKGKLINGYEDHSFKAEKNMTRAEVATLLAKFAPGEISGVQNFKDVKGHWAEKYLGYAVSKGWIKGYEDNSFRPDEDITRAEFVSIINNVLGRHTKVENMTLDKKEYKDLDKNKWYYADIEEAVNGHKQKIEEGQEKWVEVTHYDIEM